jgi:CheY-like chemotaxis protein
MWHVLVVDDDRGIRELLRAVLELEGFAVTTAVNGAQALELLARANEAWVVLMDVMMPGVGGVEACRWLAAGNLAQRHRVALMTAGLLDDVDCPPPARTILRKPFDVDAVVRLVRALARELDAPSAGAQAAGGLCDVGLPAAS